MVDGVTGELNCLEIRYMPRFTLTNYNSIYKAISYFGSNIMPLICSKALMAILENLINTLVTENHSNYTSRRNVLIFEIRHISILILM